MMQEYRTEKEIDNRQTCSHSWRLTLLLVKRWKEQKNRKNVWDMHHTINQIDLIGISNTVHRTTDCPLFSHTHRDINLERSHSGRGYKTHNHKFKRVEIRQGKCLNYDGIKLETHSKKTIGRSISIYKSKKQFQILSTQRRSKINLKIFGTKWKQECSISKCVEGKESDV